MLTSTLRQGPIYTYNIFSLLKNDPVLKIGEENTLKRRPSILEATPLVPEHKQYKQSLAQKNKLNEKNQLN